LTLREEFRLRVFENRVLRRIFGPRRDEVTGGWGKQHDEELRNLYSVLCTLVKEDEMDRAYSTNLGEEDCMYIGGKSRRKVPTKKSRLRYVDNIKPDLGDIE
jgi:hypothetical protein